IQGAAAAEARIRGSWLALKNGDVPGARRLLAQVSTPVDGRERYLFALVNGHIYRAEGDLDASERSYRSALDASPGAQSARIALVALLENRGAAAEAAALADTVQSAD